MLPAAIPKRRAAAATINGDGDKAPPRHRKAAVSGSSNPLRNNLDGISNNHRKHRVGVSSNNRRAGANNNSNPHSNNSRHNLKHPVGDNNLHNNNNNPHKHLLGHSNNNNNPRNNNNKNNHPVGANSSNPRNSSNNRRSLNSASNSRHNSANPRNSNNNRRNPSLAAGNNRDPPHRNSAAGSKVLRQHSAQEVSKANKGNRNSRHLAEISNGRLMVELEREEPNRPLKQAAVEEREAPRNSAAPMREVPLYPLDLAMPARIPSLRLMEAARLNNNHLLSNNKEAEGGLSLNRGPAEEEDCPVDLRPEPGVEELPLPLSSNKEAEQGLCRNPEPAAEGDLYRNPGPVTEEDYPRQRPQGDLEALMRADRALATKERCCSSTANTPRTRSAPKRRAPSPSTSTRCSPAIPTCANTCPSIPIR